MGNRVNRELLEQKLYVTFVKPADPIVALPSAELADPKRMLELLNVYAPLIKAKDLQAAAAYFANWCAGLAVAQQFCASVWNCVLDLSADNLEIALYADGGYGRFAYVLREWKENVPDSDAGRDGWLSSELSRFYGGTLRPMFEAAAQASGLTVGHLWGMIPTKLNYYMRALKEEPKLVPSMERLTADYMLLRKGIDAREVFGRAKNPLDVNGRPIESLLDPDQQVYMKNVCCLYYRTEGGSYCYTCPRMKESERAERRAAARAEQEAAKAQIG
ncbi:(2Fe-2S)-binding protein [Paenibacillus thermoaerophilus]|uniref:(2Fe-2S)-binding protein n=1 Tax=Paenibacillus thermoaerophilus TaxID=1215385 RepID=A0ABW2UZC6_9BACL|nr:(2Fe-2S)-binding protein [Paenibacillus thermoaerophilus]TMV17412.1 Fe-S oxidoreductase [Paenibacillus thermoaerophilus]